MSSGYLMRFKISYNLIRFDYEVCVVARVAKLQVI